MKVSGINQSSYHQYYYQGGINKQTNRPIGTGMELSNNFYYPMNISFGIANAGKLKKLISYGLPCMYTGVETIDPKKIQKMLKNKYFNLPAREAIKYLSRFEWNMNSSDEVDYIEKDIYYILKEQAGIFPDKTIKEIFLNLAPLCKKELRQKQDPIFKTLMAHSFSLPQEYRYRVHQLLQETDDKINERPVALPFSTTEFRYKLDKIKQDIGKLHDKNAMGIVCKLQKMSEDFGPKTTAKNVYQHRKILSQMETYVNRSILSDNEQLQELMEASKSRLNNEKMKVPFSRKAFIFDLNKILEEVGDEELTKVFNKIAEKLPTSQNNIAAYIVKFSKEPSEKIAYRLLWPYFGTIEHIDPASNGGPDCMANYGIATARENSDRSSTIFTEQIKRRPNTDKYSQKLIDRLISYAINGIFAKENVQDKYIYDLKNTVATQSEGAIILDTSKLSTGKYCSLGPHLFSFMNNYEIKNLNLDKQKLHILQS